tara:strand:+ start:8033 stop:8758 length:726 start_codon:yes stop_codon:yes gene_type:complete
MSKVIKITLAMLLIVAVVMVMNLDSGLKSLIETLGPEMTGGQVSVEDVDVGLLSGEGRFEGLVIGNPDSFDTEYAFSLGEISFQLDIQSLGRDTIVVETLRIFAPQIMMESGRNGSNLDKILENIQRYLGSSNRAPAPAGDASKKIIIRDLVISHAVLNYGLLGSTTVQLPLPELHLTNIGERGQGVSIAEACAKIITEISSSAAHSALRSGVIKDVAVKLEDRLKSKADNVKTLFKGLKK